MHYGLSYTIWGQVMAGIHKESAFFKVSSKHRKLKKNNMEKFVYFKC